MLGIDINETQNVQIKDASFEIGVIPYVIRLRLDAEAVTYSKKQKEGEAVSFESIFLQNMNYVKYAVKGHSGIKDKKGNAIPFKGITEKIGSREILVASDETLDMYLAMGIITELVNKIVQANMVTEEMEKN